MPSKHRVTINLAEHEHAELHAISENHRVSVAWLGRQAIIDFLARYKQEDLPLQLPLSLSSKKKVVS